MPKLLYLDNAATTKVHPDVVDAMLPYYSTFYGNASSIHALGRKSRTELEKARKTIAKGLNASTGEIFFTSGGTESNNMVLQNAVRDLNVKRIIRSKVEHHCVLNTTNYLAQKGIEVEEVNNDSLGFFDLNHLEELLQASTETTLVSLIHANNEIGTVNDIKKIGELVKQYGGYFHSDTVQAITRIPFDLQELNIDFISSSAHKFYGPKGIGFLYINADVPLQPLLYGGAQERNMRAGTENLPAIMGMAKAFEIANENRENYLNKISEIKQYFIAQLQAKIDDIDFNGDISEQSLPTVLNVSFPHSISSDMLLFKLDIEGVCCSAGSACSSGANHGSHVIQALNTNLDRPSIRFSFSYENTKEEIDQVIEIMKTL